MPSMMMSPASRDETFTFLRVAARFCSFASAWPDNNKGFSSPPPWGLTNFDMDSSLLQFGVLTA